MEATPGTVVEDVETGWVGAVVAVEKAGGVHVVHLEDRRGKVKAFPLGPGFLVDGSPVSLTAPKGAQRAALAAAEKQASRTASGSVAVHDAKARVAIGSRIFVEGRHDAELVEKVWGHDLRVEGVVVEMLDGVDDLAAAIRDFAPGRGRRMGVLVDHLVPGSKESRIVAEANRLAPEHVLVLGHPYVDVWQSVRPQRLGMEAWPTIPARWSGSAGSAPTSAGPTTPRPTSPAPGSRSWAPSATMPTSSPPSSGASRNSSTSSRPSRGQSFGPPAT